MQQNTGTRKKVVLVGHPNVGKSAVFYRITGKYVSVSNYPGTTVDIFAGHATVNGQDYEVLDTPGINNLFASSEEEQVTLNLLRKEKPDLIVQVADGKNLRRTLLLTAQLARLKLPMVLDLNMTDERNGKGIRVDCQRLADRLEIPVMETTAITGQGVEQVLLALDSEALCSIGGLQPFEWVEEILLEVRRQGEVAGGSFTSRTRLLTIALAIGTLLHFESYFGPWFGWLTIHGLLTNLLQRIGSPETLTSIIAVFGGFLLPVLLPFLVASHVDPAFNEHFGVWARKPVSSALILISVLSLMYQFVGNIGAQSLVGVLEEGLFGTYLNPLLQSVIPTGFVYDLLVGQYGVISVGITYSVAIVLPVISTFFIAFSFLEDSGYLPRLTILSDRLLRAMGLNGKALLPMVLGLGCVTMATMTTRILNTRRERIIATLLLALAVPCSAQLGVILGIMSGISLSAVAVVFATVFIQLIVVGTIVSRLLPGRRSLFILELPPIRNPLWPNIFRKTYVRVRWFLREALPLFLLGTLILFITDRLGILQSLIAVVEPVVSELLDLPRQITTVFFMGFLRRDYGAAGLFDLARRGQLDSIQIAVSLTVITLFVPCIANFFVIIKEYGLRIALTMVLFISFYSIGVAAVLNRLLRGWTV